MECMFTCIYKVGRELILKCNVSKASNPGIRARDKAVTDSKYSQTFLTDLSMTTLFDTYQL